MFSRELYVIMDKKRQFIVQFGADKFKTKYLTHVDQKDTNNSKLTLRVFFYDTLGRAKSGMNSYFMWLNDMIHYYPEILEDPKLPHQNNYNAYDKFIANALLSQLEVVKVTMSVNEVK